MGMSSASMGMDQGMWNWGANSRITMFLEGEGAEPGRAGPGRQGEPGGPAPPTPTYPRTLAQSS